MIEIVTQLSGKLKEEIKNAEEIWIAVALMNFDGLEFVIKNLKLDCKQNYLIGIDLPTDPKALKKLNELQLISDLHVKLFAENDYFHPKLYLIRKQKNILSAFIGSANLTNGGLNNNVELTTYVDDQNVCNSLLRWFEKYNKIGKPLTTTFIEQYQIEFSEKQKRKKVEEKTVKKEKKCLNEEFNATFTGKSHFIETLNNYRKSKEYNKIVTERQKTVEELRKDLDYPKHSNIEIDSYFSHWELGHLISISLPKIKRHMPELKKLLNFLCDESIDVAIRYNRALKGNLKIEGINKAFISKVLVAHKPELYFVKNEKTEKALRKYGIKLPRGLTEGEKYKITCRILRQICEDTNIQNLAVLDHYLYLEGIDE